MRPLPPDQRLTENRLALLDGLDDLPEGVHEIPALRHGDLVTLARTLRRLIRRLLHLVSHPWSGYSVQSAQPPTPLFPPPHPLDAARLRHQRSREGLKRLEAALDDFSGLHEGRYGPETLPLAYLDADTENWLPLPDFTAAPIAAVFEASEMLYNLKVALDYALYALFKDALAKGRFTPAMCKSSRHFAKLEERVQFPIVSSPEKLRPWRSEHWQWLRKEERTLIRRSQPYHRPLMAYLGYGYHNLDKHRDLQPFIVEVDLSRASFRDIDAVTDPPCLRWQNIPVYGFNTEGLPSNRPVAMYANGSVSVLLQDRAPVVETLQVLETEIASLISDLSAAF